VAHTTHNQTHARFLRDASSTIVSVRLPLSKEVFFFVLRDSKTSHHHPFGIVTTPMI
jgi:hypothetical protein